MTWMQKIELKIGHRICHISKNDLVLDNGSIIQVMTQPGVRFGSGFEALRMSKKLFKDFKMLEFLVVDEALTKKANEGYKVPFLTYYRFNIEKLIKYKYPVIEDEEEGKD